MVTFSRQSTINADGNTAQVTDTVEGAESSKVQLTLEQSLSGELTTRTDNNTGVVTSAAHGLTTSDFVSVGWTDPDTGEEMYRANMDITSVTTDTISVDGGQGDNLPLVNTDVIIGKVASRVVAWDGTGNGMLGFMGNCGARRGTLTAQEIGTLAGLAGTDLFKQCKSASPGYCWLSGADGSFAFTGDILILTAALLDVNGAGEATFVGLDT